MTLERFVEDYSRVHVTIIPFWLRHCFISFKIVTIRFSIDKGDDGTEQLLLRTSECIYRIWPLFA